MSMISPEDDSLPEKMSKSNAKIYSNNLDYYIYIFLLDSAEYLTTFWQLVSTLNIKPCPALTYDGDLNLWASVKPQRG